MAENPMEELGIEETWRYLKNYFQLDNDKDKLFDV